MRGTLQVDPASAVPIWKQIEEGVRRLVAGGALAAGDPVPSVRDLARDLAVNPATVAKAYQQLTEAGLLVVRRGEGTFVQAGPEGQRREREALLAQGAAAYAGLARNLGFARGEAESALERAWTEEKGGKA
ncbi:MAG TPA: GntR family transcriptional regulator [Holophaga sp.]|nr:GntR family transcriptional regulator [Holophaga sp.]